MCQPKKNTAAVPLRRHQCPLVLLLLCTYHLKLRPLRTCINFVYVLCLCLLFPSHRTPLVQHSSSPPPLTQITCRLITVDISKFLSLFHASSAAIDEGLRWGAVSFDCYGTVRFDPTPTDICDTTFLWRFRGLGPCEFYKMGFDTMLP